MMRGLSLRKRFPGTWGEGGGRAQEVAASLPSCHTALVNGALGAQGFEQPPFGALENRANAPCRRAHMTRLPKKPFADFVLCLLLSGPPGPQFLLRGVSIYKWIVPLDFARDKLRWMRMCMSDLKVFSLKTLSFLWASSSSWDVHIQLAHSQRKGPSPGILQGQSQDAHQPNYFLLLPRPQL